MGSSILPLSSPLFPHQFNEKQQWTIPNFLPSFRYFVKPFLRKVLKLDGTCFLGDPCVLCLVNSTGQLHFSYGK